MNKKTDKEIPGLEIDVRETFDIDIDLKSKDGFILLIEELVEFKNNIVNSINTLF